MGLCADEDELGANASLAEFLASVDGELYDFFVVGAAKAAVAAADDDCHILNLSLLKILIILPKLLQLFSDIKDDFLKSVRKRK